MPYQDGTFPSGSYVITINSVQYKANSCSLTDGSNTINITDNTGAPSGALSFQQVKTGTAELQFAANTTAEPTTAAVSATTGTFSLNVNGSNINCFITSCTVNKPKDAPWTASIAFQKKIN